MLARGLVRYTPTQEARALERMHRAVLAGVAARCPTWWPELGPLGFVEQGIVRRVVAQRVRFQCSSPAVLAGDSRLEQLRAAIGAHQEVHRG